MKAVAYYRTSSTTGVGEGKDSLPRQREAVSEYAKRERLVITDSFYDAAVSGADPIQERPGFSALLDRIEGNGVRIVLVEDASRFARELLTQELGLLALISRGVRVIAANGDELTDTSDPMRKAMRQVAGAFAELEKSRLVSKLKAARDRKRATGVKVEGRKSVAELNPGLLEAARKAYRASPKTGKPTLRLVAQRLFELGYTTSKGKPLSASMIKRLLATDCSAPYGIATGLHLGAVVQCTITYGNRTARDCYVLYGIENRPLIVCRKD